MNNCNNCPTLIARYIQEERLVCDRCYSSHGNMVCLRCRGKRIRRDNPLLMSCPCYDDDIEVEQEYITDEDTQDEHAGEMSD